MKNKNKYYLNIAMLGQKHIPSREGGVEVVVEEICTRMVRQGHKVTCLNRSGHHVSGKKFGSFKLKEYKGIRLKVVPTINRRGLAAMSSSVFGAIEAAFGDYDIVHFHAEGPAFMCWLPKMMGKKIVVTIHGLDHQRVKWGRFASLYIRMGEKNAVKYADDIIVLSREVKQYFNDLYGRETVLIPNGVNEPTYMKADIITQMWGLKKDSYILYLGRLVPEKGIKYLIEAFKGVKTNKKLVIAGGSSNTDTFINEIKELAIGDERIIFTGFVQGKVLEELYSNDYIYTLPSDLEGMPLSLLEAMSYGNCCLTSDIAECADVVEDKGIMFGRGNVAELREKLQLLCDDVALVKKYRTGVAEYICGKYNWDDIVEETLMLYRGDSGDYEESDDDGSVVSVDQQVS
jgi:glycosyltransferase involved in cell wall biosynthesis